MLIFSQLSLNVLKLWGPNAKNKTRETVIVLIHIWRKRPKEKNSKGRKQKLKCGTIQGINRKKFAIIKTLQRLVFELLTFTNVSVKCKKVRLNKVGN